MDPVEKPSECSPAGTPEPSALAGELNPAAEGSAADDMDEARLKKLNHLKQAIADGTYHVPAEEVARKVIEHMLEPEE